MTSLYRTPEQRSYFPAHPKHQQKPSGWRSGTQPPVPRQPQRRYSQSPSGSPYTEQHRGGAASGLHELIYGFGMSKAQSELDIFGPFDRTTVRMPPKSPETGKYWIGRRPSTGSKKSWGTRGKQTESPSSHDPLEVTSKDPWVPNDLENRGSGQPLSFKKLFRSSNKQPKEEKLVWVENWDAEYQQQSNYQQQRRRNSNHHHQYQGVSTEHPPSRHDVARNTTRHHHRPESFYPHHQSSLSTSHIVMATPVTCYYHVSPAAQYVFYQPLYYHMPVMTSTPTSSTQGQHPHHYVYPEVHSQEHPVYNTYTSRTDTDNDDMHRRASTISDTTSSAESTRRASNGSSTISTHSTAGSSVITIPEEDKEPASPVTPVPTGSSASDHEAKDKVPSNEVNIPEPIIHPRQIDNGDSTEKDVQNLVDNEPSSTELSVSPPPSKQATEPVKDISTNHGPAIEETMTRTEIKEDSVSSSENMLGHEPDTSLHVPRPIGCSEQLIPVVDTPDDDAELANEPDALSESRNVSRTLPDGEQGCGQIEQVNENPISKDCSSSPLSSSSSPPPLKEEHSAMPIWADPVRLCENPTRFEYVQQYMKEHKLSNSSPLPLAHPHVFYFSETLASKHQKIATDNYMSSVKQLFGCRTVWEFSARWRLFKQRKCRPSQLQHNQNLYCFVEGVAPMWEDSRNRDGGRLTVCPPRGTLDETFEWMLASLVGGSLSDYGAVGVVLSRRARSDRIELWLDGSAANPDTISALKDKLCGYLPSHLQDFVTAARFKKHFDK